jgi:hypothetical protein
VMLSRTLLLRGAGVRGPPLPRTVKHAAVGAQCVARHRLAIADVSGSLPLKRGLYHGFRRQDRAALLVRVLAEQ